MSQRINLQIEPYVRNMYTKNYNKTLNNFDPAVINALDRCDFHTMKCKNCLLKNELNDYYEYQYGRPYSYYTLPENYYYPYY